MRTARTAAGSNGQHSVPTSVRQRGRRGTRTARGQRHQALRTSTRTQGHPRAGAARTRQRSGRASIRDAPCKPQPHVAQRRATRSICSLPFIHMSALLLCRLLCRRAGQGRASAEMESCAARCVSLARVDWSVDLTARVPLPAKEPKPLDPEVSMHDFKPHAALVASQACSADAIP